MLLRSSLLGFFVAVMAIVGCGGDDTSASASNAGSSSTAGAGGSGQGGGGLGGADSKSVTAICDAYCDCVGCTPMSQAGCPGIWNGTHKDATIKGCLAEYESLVDCLTTTTTCRGGMTLDQCDDERAAVDACLH